MKNILTVLIILVLVFGISNFSAADDNIPKEKTITVMGQGKVTSVPDQAEMIIEVQEDGPKMSEVSNQVNDKTKKVFEIIKSFGIADKDYQTVNYNVQPKYKYDKLGNQQRIGYAVSNQITLVIRDLNKIGDVLEAVTQAEVSRVEGPFFDFSDREKIQIEALKAAVADAHSKAEALCQASGAELGNVYSIDQSSVSMPETELQFATRSVLREEPETVPVSKGQNEVTAQVEVVYLLK